MYTAFAEVPRFSVTAQQKNRSEFCVQHYAGKVVYSSESFLEKNKDETPADAIDLCLSSKNILLLKLFTAEEPVVTAAVERRKSGSGMSSQGFVSVCSAFKGQLTSLISTINSTSPHYIRCIKPNDKNMPSDFVKSKVAEQLLNSGIISAVQVSRAGFKYRYAHSDFFFRYRTIANPISRYAFNLPNRIHGGSDEKSEALCARLWQAIIDESDQPSELLPSPSPKHRKRLKSWRVGSAATLSSSSFQVGKSMIFLKEEAFTFLESRVAKRNNSYVKRLQALVRGRLCRRLSLLQQRRAEVSRRKIYDWMRSRRQRITFVRCIQGIKALQSLARMRVRRKAYRAIVLERRAIVLQRVMRRMCNRNKLQKFRKAVVLVQNRLRKKKAEETLKWLKFLKDECY